MPFGVPRTEEARAKRHAEIYGEGEMPPEVRKRLGPVMAVTVQAINNLFSDFHHVMIKHSVKKLVVPLTKGTHTIDSTIVLPKGIFLIGRGILKRKRDSK